MKKLFTLILLILSVTAARAQNIQGGMETWRDFTVVGEDLEAPDGWYGFDSLVIWKQDDSLGFVLTGQQLFQDSDIVHGGDYSAKLETTEIPGLFAIPGLLANAQPQFISSDFDVDDPLSSVDFIGGTTVTERIDYVNAWVHYFSADTSSPETGIFVARAYLAGQGVNGADSLVGFGELAVFDNAGFELVSVHINYTDPDVTPDLIKVIFITTTDFSNAISGTTMYVDDVTLSTTSVKNTLVNTANVKCYPNPTTGVVNVNSTSSEPMTMQVFSLSGQVVSTKKFSGSTQTDLSHLVDGMYFYSIRTAGGEVILQDKLVISK